MNTMTQTLDTPARELALPLANPSPFSAFSRRNAMRRLVRCLFAERIIDRSALSFNPPGNGACIALWNRHAFLFLDDLQAGPADTLLLGGSITLVEADGRRTPVEQPAQLLDLVAGLFDFQPTAEALEALKRDVDNSVANDALARDYRRAWNAHLHTLVRASGAAGLVDYLRRSSSVRDAAMLLEQWGSLEGHPFYPTWKCKPDLSPSQVMELSPEFNARVRVRIAALRADMAYVERMPHVHSYQDWFAAQFPQLWDQWCTRLAGQGRPPSEWLPLPIHGWHLDNFVAREYAAEIAEGILLLDGPDVVTQPTMSFRSMLPQLPGSPPFIKLPVALWLTSEQRSMQAKSIHMGPRISDVIQRILDKEGGFGRRLEIFPEEVALHYRHAQRKEDRPGRHLSVAYRASRDAFERRDGLLPITVAALFTPAPGTGRPLATELAGSDASPEAVQAWFRQYARVVTHPVIAIYLLYGIGLEAHQQNTSVLVDAQGQAQGILIRDFGDGRTYAPLLAQHGMQLKPYVHPGILPTVFTDDIAPVRSFVLDACFVCHLHEVALLLTQAYGLAPLALWRILAEETQSAFDAVQGRVELTLWEAERSAFLEQPWPTRSVLRMHLMQYADYRVQHQLANPLAQALQDAA
jgi:D-ornithine---citrate ligase